jgi:DNA-binding NarL/FixJ family response regulator
MASQSISVLLSGMSRILGDIVRSALADEPHVEITGEPVELIATLEVTRRLRPSVVICGTPPDAAPGLYEALLRADPRLRIVELASDGRSARIHELVPRTVDLGEVSLTRLVSAVRGED